MPVEVVLGCQWGDEGKGKIVDLLAEQADWVARFQGGANAGHTVWRSGERVILHLVPTGILHPHVQCALGNGVVLDPEALVAELETLAQLGLEADSRLRISAGAHLVTPLHHALESARAEDRRIGTTRRGIGPAYAEKISRRGLRAELLTRPAALRAQLDAGWEQARDRLGLDDAGLRAAAGVARDELQARLAAAAKRLGPLVCDVTDLLLSAEARGARLLCEGAQGTWLDIDHGTYPFVTSSNTSTGGVCTGLGLPPQRIQRVIGVVKAYTTRVGEGPFPTEFTGAWADRFRDQAGEYGATTQRPRRCGWFDGVLTRRACRINGIDELIVTKLDVLSGIDPLRVAEGYAGDGEARLPAWCSAEALGNVEPVYAEHAGWQEDLKRIDDPKELPSACRRYVSALAEAAGVSVGRVSIGPERHQVLTLT